MRDRTRLEQTVKITHLFRRALVTLLIIAVVLAVLYLALAWYKGVFQFPTLPFLRPSNSFPTSLTIHVIPADARIMLNGKAYDPRAAPVPGNYEVTVSLDGYYPTTERIRVHPNTANEASIRLVPIAVAAPVAESALAATWDGQDNLYFINQADAKIYRWANGSAAALADVLGEVYQLVILTAGDRGYVLAAHGSDSPSQLSVVDLHNGSSADMPISGYAALGPDGKTIWGINADTQAGAGKPVWSLEPGGTPKWTSLESPGWATAGIQALVDPSGHWLAIDSPKGIAIWDIPSGKLLTTFTNASTPLWIGGAHTGLVYRASDGSLDFAEEDLDWSSSPISADVPSPLAVMPGSTEIVFTRYDPFSGGTSFWAVDTATKGIRLLSEAATESGHVAEFTVSPDGKKIAYVNRSGTLYVVTLEP